MDGSAKYGVPWWSTSKRKEEGEGKGEKEREDRNH